MTMEQAELEAAAATISFEDIAEQYIANRDELDAISKRHEEELAPLQSDQKLLERLAMIKLNQTGQESAKTDKGTVFKKTSTTVRVLEFEEVLAFIFKPLRAFIKPELLEQAFAAIPVDFLNKAVNKTAVVEYNEKHGQVPPGVALEQFTVVQIRRPN